MAVLKIDTYFHTDALMALGKNDFCTLIKIAFPDEAQWAETIWETEFSKYDCQSRIYYLRGRKKFTNLFEIWALGWEAGKDAEKLNASL